MTKIIPDPTKQADILKELLHLIEAIRYQRYERWHKHQHPLGRKFTQIELTQVALPTYGNLLVGRSKRLPAREQILDVASYLECTIAETNDLLCGAEYLPKYHPLSDTQYKSAIARARQLVQFITLPALVMGKGGVGIMANTPFLRLNNLPTFEAWLPEQCNVIHSAFDTRLPSHAMYHATPEIWSATATGSVQLLKSTTKAYQHEKWFLNQLDIWHQLPEFTDYWHQLALNPDPFTEMPNVKMITPLIEQPIEEQGMMIPFTRDFEVCLLVWQPVDDAAQHVYDLLECNYHNTRWSEMFNDLTE